MSRYPPGGPPPPYNYHTPASTGVTFVPAPVMMPVTYPLPTETGPPQPTYINNYYHYTDQPPLIQPVEEIIDWISANPTTAHQYTHRAFVAGKEGWDGSPLWIIRAHHGGAFLPGKLAIKHRAAYVPNEGKEIPVHNFDILLARSHNVRWLSSSNGHVPPGAIVAGNSHTGEPLYIGRVNHMNSITPGKVHPSHQCTYISFGGQELSFKQYEVLCRIVG